MVRYIDQGFQLLIFDQIFQAEIDSRAVNPLYNTFFNYHICYIFSLILSSISRKYIKGEGEGCSVRDKGGAMDKVKGKKQDELTKVNDNGK